MNLSGLHATNIYVRMYINILVIYSFDRLILLMRAREMFRDHLRSIHFFFFFGTHTSSPRWNSKYTNIILILLLITYIYDIMEYFRQTF